jgi:hypothetical protein
VAPVAVTDKVVACPEGMVTPPEWAVMTGAGTVTVTGIGYE